MARMMPSGRARGSPRWPVLIIAYASSAIRSTPSRAPRSVRRESAQLREDGVARDQPPRNGGARHEIAWARPRGRPGKSEGKVRFVGFTGHKSPAIHLKRLAYDYPYDTVQMPLNCFDGTYRSFEQHVLPELHRRAIAALGMKSLGGDGQPILHGVVAPEEACPCAHGAGRGLSPVVPRPCT